MSKCTTLRVMRSLSSRAVFVRVKNPGRAACLSPSPDTMSRGHCVTEGNRTQRTKHTKQNTSCQNCYSYELAKKMLFTFGLIA